MAAYGDFALVYDRLMDDFDYPGWAGYYLKLLERAGVQPGSLCDCACGTGSLSVEFARRGIEVTASDLSGAMLEAAAEKTRRQGLRILYARQDMCALALPHPVDAVICGCDGVNYLLSSQRIRAFFEHARACLKPGGALAFDLSSLHKLRSVLGDGFFGEEREDVAYLWSNRWNEEDRTVTMDLTFFVREGNGLYRRFAERHRQRAHDPAELAELLKECGFDRVKIYGDRTFEAPDPDEDRIHICALRA